MGWSGYGAVGQNGGNIYVFAGCNDLSNLRLCHVKYISEWVWINHSVRLSLFPISLTITSIKSYFSCANMPTQLLWSKNCYVTIIFYQRFVNDFCAACKYSAPILFAVGTTLFFNIKKNEINEGLKPIYGWKLIVSEYDETTSCVVRTQSKKMLNFNIKIDYDTSWNWKDKIPKCHRRRQIELERPYFLYCW